MHTNDVQNQCKNQVHGWLWLNVCLQDIIFGRWFHGMTLSACEQKWHEKSSANSCWPFRIQLLHLTLSLWSLIIFFHRTPTIFPLRNVAFQCCRNWCKILPPLRRSIQLCSNHFTCCCCSCSVCKFLIIQQFPLWIVTRTCSCTAAATAPAVCTVASWWHEWIFAANTACSTRCTRDVFYHNGCSRLLLTRERMRQEPAIEEKMISWWVSRWILRGRIRRQATKFKVGILVLIWGARKTEHLARARLFPAVLHGG